MMQIEAGKFYRTRDGRKVGPISHYSTSPSKHWTAPELEGAWAPYWYADGQFWPEGAESKPGTEGRDLVEEWADSGPVRTVTRKEIVPGKYGFIEIDGANGAVQPEGISLWFPPNKRWTEMELRAAAATMTELADALALPLNAEGGDK
jgi:hypothetical protein